MFVIKEFYLKDDAYIGSTFFPSASEALCHFIKHHNKYEKIYSVLSFLDYDEAGKINEKTLSEEQIHQYIREE